MPVMSGSTSIEGVLVDWCVDQSPALDARLPVAWLSREQKAAELQRLQAEKAMRAAYEAELILGLADDSSELPDDHPAGGAGSWRPDAELPGVDESFTHELSMALNCGRRSAAIQAQRAWTYRENLPGTWAALAAGTLDEPRAKALVEVLQHTSPEVARSVEAALLPEAGELPVGRLKQRALKLLVERDADAVDRRRGAARRQADVRTYPSPLDGMTTLAADLTTPESAECFDIVDQLARMLKADGDPRPIGELRASVVSDLIRRPWDTTRPAVTAHLTVTAPLASLDARPARAGEVNGLAITAAHVRELLARLDALGLRAPQGGSHTVTITGPDGELLAAVPAARLARLARRGCPEHPARDCGCPVLGRPSVTGAYTPTVDQRLWVKTRDATCRFPNCGQRVGWADLDHVIPHACGGETSCTNLCCLCRTHHRLKTRRKDWRFQLTDDGVLFVTTPSGITRTTRPPGLRPRAAEGPPAQPSPDRPPPVVEPDDDPPPY